MSKKDILYSCRTKLHKEETKMFSIQKEVQVKLTKGLLDMIVLQFLKEQPMHGYQIISKIRKSFGVYFGPSTIYPLLSSLEKRGYVSSEWNMENERPRKVCKLTNEGQNLLNFTENSLNLIVKTIGTNSTSTHADEMQQKSTAAPYFLKKKTISALAQ
jgi:PadR family transcriptional regulator PadR